MFEILYFETRMSERLTFGSQEIVQVAFKNKTTFFYYLLNGLDVSYLFSQPAFWIKLGFITSSSFGIGQ